MDGRVTLTFSPSGETVSVEPGTTVSEAARHAGLLFAAPCAGRGVCGGCGIKVIAGQLEGPDDVEARTLARAPDGVRLACRARVIGAVEVAPLFASGAAEARAASPCARTRAGSAADAAAAVERSGVARRSLVAGVDLGTTSVAALIADRATGREIARASVANRQAPHGADVLARISAALGGHADELRQLAIDSVHGALARAAEAGGVSLGDVERVALAGNSAMVALLEGAELATLAAHPFAPPVAGGRMRTETRKALGLSATTTATLVAPIAAFVGGDALAASLAAGLIDADRPMLLVDIGTNAELVLARPEGLMVASTAAGPAFEGVGISCGGPATPGAVERVVIDKERVELCAIGDAAPKWLSGAGLVSAARALLDAGHIGQDGRLVAEGPLRARFSADPDGVLGVDLGVASSDPIVLTQLDVRSLQLAKAAVRVGVESLLHRAGISASEVAEVLVAGAFGAALDPADLVALGVLPAGAPAVRRVGNAALDGATAIALDATLERLAESAAADAEHVDLALEASFGEAFVRATAFEPYLG